VRFNIPAAAAVPPPPPAAAAVPPPPPAAAAVPPPPPAAAAVPPPPPAAAAGPHHPAHALAPHVVAHVVARSAQPPPPPAVAPPPLALNAFACWPPAPPAVVPPAARAPPAEPILLNVFHNDDPNTGVPELLPGWQANADLPENNGIPSLHHCFRDEINPITGKNKRNEAWRILEYMGEVDRADWVEEVYRSPYCNRGLISYGESFKNGCCAYAIWGYAMGFNNGQFTQEFSLHGWKDHITRNRMHNHINYWNANVHPILCYAWRYVLRPSGINLDDVLKVNFKNWRDLMMRSSQRGSGRSGLPIISNEWFLAHQHDPPRQGMFKGHTFHFLVLMDRVHNRIRRSIRHQPNGHLILDGQNLDAELAQHVRFYAIGRPP
jgi:hypothetical protein